MTDEKVAILPEKPADSDVVAALSARVLGPGRFARTAYRVREGGRAIDSLRFAAWSGDELIGSIRFTELAIGGEKGALLLGPLVVDPRFARQGCGLALIGQGLKQARENGHGLVILVGDLEYYERAGFVRCPDGQITLPGPVDPGRLLAAELKSGALANYRGLALRLQAPG